MSQAGSATGWHGEIRRAEVSDAEGVATLAAESPELRRSLYKLTAAREALAGR